MEDDATLLKRYAEKADQDAFGQLVGRHLGLVYGVALRRTNGDRYLAEDIAQETFAQLAREAAKLVRHPSLAGWLYLTARHASANAVRGEARRRRRELEANAMDDECQNEEAETDWRSLRAALDAALDELPATDREAVLLRFFNERAYAEIGAVLRLTENAARMRVDRALERLQTVLARRGITSTAAALSAFLAAEAGAAVPAGLPALVTSTVLAGAGACGTAGWIAFMTTSKILTGVAAVVVCGAVGTAVYEHHAREEASAALEVQVAQVAALRRDVANWETRAKEAEQKGADSARTATGDAQATMKRGDAKPEATNPAPALGGTGFDLAAVNPEYRALFLAQQRASLPLQYGRLYAKLHLTKEQIAEFEAAQCAHIDAMIEAITVAHAQGSNSADPALRNAQLTEDDWAARTRHALGDSGVAELKTWGENQMLRNYADTLATQLYFTSAPLGGEQGEQLTQIIKANTGAPQDIGLYRTAGATNWDAVLAQANTVLSAEQLAVFRSVVESQRMLFEMSNLTIRLQAENGTGTQ